MSSGDGDRRSDATAGNESKSGGGGGGNGNLAATTTAVPVIKMLAPEVVNRIAAGEVRKKRDVKPGWRVCILLGKRAL